MAAESHEVTRALPWQRDAWAALRDQLQSRRLPHALMIEGTPGTGRERFASTVAAALLCERPVDDGACGACRACGLVGAGSHPDLLRVAPAEEGKAIGVDAVRAAIAFIGGTASRGGHKVLLVNPAERLTLAAHNAFLKCLEEPTAGTVILLVTARGHPIPATIRSRCQRRELPAPTRDAALAWLRQQGEGAASAALEAVLDIAGGRPLAALRLVESGADKALGSLQASLREVSRDSNQHRRAMTLEAAAAAVDNEHLLDLLERDLRDWLRSQPPSVLRSERGWAAFRGLDELSALRRARRSGSNPNPDLLRFRAVQAYIGQRNA